MKIEEALTLYGALPFLYTEDPNVQTWLCFALIFDSTWCAIGALEIGYPA